MFENVQKRFLERRNKQLVSLMAYLNNSTTKLGRKDPIFSYSTRKEIQNLAQRLQLINYQFLIVSKHSSFHLVRNTLILFKN